MVSLSGIETSKLIYIQISALLFGPYANFSSLLFGFFVAVLSLLRLLKSGIYLLSKAQFGPQPRCRVRKTRLGRVVILGSNLCCCWCHGHARNTVPFLAKTFVIETNSGIKDS